ncbi:hypothetical protein HYS93_00855 [Candidatus Daviesbacteria bacterium]|nr:hypothetical protein [Candidatus Daviesbacteria bacterium]
MSFIKRLLEFLLSLVTFSAIIYFIEPPKSWTQASIFQILIFFIPLLLLFTLLLNLVLNHLARSFSLALGLEVVIVLWAVDYFNIVSLLLTGLITGLLLYIVPKTRAIKGLRAKRLRLTESQNQSKLSLFPPAGGRKLPRFRRREER